VAVNSIAFLGLKSIKTCENHDTASCNSRKRWSFITILHLYMSKPSSKSNGGLIGEAWSPLLHNLGRILSPKTGFSSSKTKWMIAKTSSHHSSSHPLAKNSHTNFGLIFTLSTIWVGQVLDKNHTKWHPFPITYSLSHLKPKFLV